MKLKIKNYKFKIINYSGMSLLEILIVVAVFSILGIVVTRSVLLTLRGSKKSESQVKVRENLSYSLSVIERQLRNADTITTTCPNTTDTSVINYIDEFGNPASFSCQDIGGSDSHIASGSARLTASDVSIISCSFECSPEDNGAPPFIDVSISARDANAVGIEGAEVTSTTKIYLRNYQ